MVMAGGERRTGLVRASFLAAIMAMPLLVGGCGSPSSYAGVSLSSAAVEPELQALARRAQSGDKHAQLELGIRFEEGRGVPRDLKRAVSLYARAAQPTGGTIWVYSPGVGKAKGRVIPVNTGPRVAGLAVAKFRLARLKQRR